MASKNDITGDLIKSKSSNEKYRDNYDRIFRKSNVVENKNPKKELNGIKTA
jgi:hypothetical protein